MKMTGLRLMFVALAVAALGTACSKQPAGDLGEAGEASQVDRVVEISMTNELRFDPSEIDASAGETIEFKLTNDANSPHEFVIGASHEHSGDMQHADENATGTLESGETGSVIWSFPESGAALFACYIDGHNEAGMTGTVTVSE